MSLDFSLYAKVSTTSVASYDKLTDCPVREHGSIRYLTVREFVERYPDRPIPIRMQHPERDDTGRKCVFDRNITHNLGSMAEAVGIYQCLWRFEETGYTKAGDMTGVLLTGLQKLCADPVVFKQYENPNGWGKHVDLVIFVMDLIDACIRFPDAKIDFSR